MEHLYVPIIPKISFILNLAVVLKNIIFVICILQQLCGTDLNIYIYTFSIVKEHDCLGPKHKYCARFYI